MTTTAKRTRKTEEQRKHDHYLTLATLRREGRLHRMPAGVSRASFDVNGEHLDAYASKSYAGYGYVVRYGDAGYECGCKQFEHRHSCPHTKDAAKRAAARYHAAEAAKIAPTVLGEAFAQDLLAHIEDDLHGPLDPIDAERAAWRAMTPEQRRAAYSATFDLSYGDVA